MRYRCQAPGSPPLGGGAASGGAAVMLAPLMGGASPSSLVGLRRGRLERLGDAVHVGRVLLEVLEDLELPLSDRGAEGGRLQVGEVEARRLGLRQLLGDRALDRIGVGARRHL